MSADVVDYLSVVLFGAAIGLGEIVSRYRDAPMRAAWSIPGALYVSLNAIAAVAALAIIRVFDFDLWVNEGGADQIRLAQVIVAGFSSMALFRSSLFTIRMGDQDIPVGPNSLLQVILGSVDRAVDRKRANERAKIVALRMAGISAAKAVDALPLLCMALMQNLPKEDQAALAEQIKLLKSSALDDKLKLLTLGLYLMDVVGESVLAGAIDSLGTYIHSREMRIVPEPGDLKTNDAVRLTAQLYDEGGRLIGAVAPRWQSANSGVAEIDGHGNLVAREQGTTTINAEYDGCLCDLVVKVT